MQSATSPPFPGFPSTEPLAGSRQVEKKVARAVANSVVQEGVGLSVEGSEMNCA